MKIIQKRYHEVEIRFLVEFCSYGAKTKNELVENIFKGIGANEMNCIDAKKIEIIVDGKRELKSEGKA